MDRRKKIRLDDKDVYSRIGAVFHIIICATKPAFENEPLARSAIATLKECAAFHDVPVYTYCFMPDHVHLAAGVGKRPMDKFVDGFKSLAIKRSWALGASGTYWQERHRDCYLRVDEDLETLCWYILMNPVRRGLVQRWEDYPYSGSLEIDGMRE